MEKKVVDISWDEVGASVKLLADCLESSSIQGLIPVSRGGLVPATMLSHLTGLPVFDMLHTSRKTVEEKYFGGSVEVPIVVVQPPYSKVPYGQQHRYCIVDDIWDTGETFRRLQVIYPKTAYAFCFQKDGADTKRQYPPSTLIGGTLEGGENLWYRFPWEKQARS